MWIRNDDPEGHATLFHLGIVPEGARFLTLSGRLHARDVVGGDALWESARLILLTRRAGDAEWRYDIPHTVIRDRGDLPWREVSRTFLVPGGPPQPGSEFQVAAQLLRSTGKLWVRDLSLRRAEERPWFPAVRDLLLGLWLVAALWIVWPLAAPLARAVRSRRLHWRGLGHAGLLALLIAITVAAVAPPSAKQAYRTVTGTMWSAGRSLLAPEPTESPAEQCIADPSASAAAGLRPLTANGPGPGAAAAKGGTETTGTDAAPDDGGFASPLQLHWLVADKLGHFAGFAALALLALLLMPWGAPLADWLVPALALPGFAALTEVWQVMATTRGASLTDVAIDFGGLLAGALVWCALGLLTRIHRQVRRQRS